MMIGYINMVCKRIDIPGILIHLIKKSIIIDLRNYPAFIYRRFSRYLNSEKRAFSKIYSPNINYPSRFTYIDDLKTSSYKSIQRKNYIIGKMKNQ
jgi:hypothetical protein